MNKKLIVTGAAGFIGSHVCDLLINRGYSVYVFDDLSTGKLENINTKAIFEKVDITKHTKVLSLVEKIKPDSILHLAAWPRIMRSVDEPIDTNMVNVNGTFVMLEAAKKVGVRRFVYSSSSSVYGDQKTFKMKESFTPHPKSLYALQKLIGENYCTFYAESFGMSIVSLRYFSVYGERQHDIGVYALVLGKFMNQFKNNVNLTIYGDGKQTRDFTHVSDVVQANLLSLTSNLPKGKNTVLNIGTSRETSVNEIAKYIGGKVKHIVPNPREKYEERRKAADINLARKVLDWKPKVVLKDELKK